MGSMGLRSSLALAAQEGTSYQGLVKTVAIAAILWSLANVAVSATALALLARSRIRHREAWEEPDFIEAHAPKNARPSDTVEEYRALRRKAQS